jgi:hypothetical protein
VVRADIDALGQALQAGDLTAAQSAFARLQQDLQAMRGGHHHHRHHHHDGDERSRDATSAAAAPSRPPMTISTAPSTSVSNVKNGDGDGGTTTFHGIDLKA